MTRIALAALVCAACGGDDGGGGTPDAATADTNTNTSKVQAVTCPTTADATVTVNTAGDSYTPKDTTIPVSAVVKFVMTAGHDAQPNPLTTSDPGLTVGFAETKCLKFTATGTYGFYCTNHSFAGTVTVN
jgi:plastocyanin